MTETRAEPPPLVVVIVEIGPVHRHQDILTASDLMWHPAGETVPYVDAVIAEQPIHLFDRMLGHQTTSLGQPMADQRNRQRRRRYHAKRRTSKRIDTLGVQVRPIQPPNKRADVVKTTKPPIHLHHTVPQTRLQLKRLQNSSNRAYTRVTENEGFVRGSTQ